MAQILIEDVRIEYGKGKTVVAVDDFSLEVGAGEFGVLLGPSGCGKSTLLNAVAGLVTPVRGRITIGDHLVFDSAASINLPPNLRDIGMVYQSYALWPHMTVFNNVAFPLKRKGLGRQAIKRRVNEVLGQVRCDVLANRYPNQLSGGQQQRVSLARALAAEPQLMLMDEPLSNLDAELRRELREEIARLHTSMGFSALYVTHDQQEALGLGSMIAVMRVGRIVQRSGPSELYRSPATVDIARFLGANSFAGRLSCAGDYGRPVVSTTFGSFEVRTSGHGDADVQLAVFPASVKLEISDSADAATVVVAKFLGDRFEYVAESHDGRLVRVVDRPLGHQLQVGDRVTARAAPDATHVYDSNGAALGPLASVVPLAGASSMRNGTIG